MKIRRFLLLLSAVSFILCTITCCTDQPYSDTNQFSYRESEFQAEIQGTLEGLEFCASIQRKKDGNTLSFLRLGSFGELTLTGDGNEITLTYGDSKSAVSPDAVDVLLSPLNALLSEEKIRRIQKKEKETELLLENNAILILDRRGIPRSYRSHSLSFDVVWWETPPYTS